jgi:hypothetical protein
MRSFLKTYTASSVVVPVTEIVLAVTVADASLPAFFFEALTGRATIEVDWGNGTKENYTTDAYSGNATATPASMDPGSYTVRIQGYDNKLERIAVQGANSWLTAVNIFKSGCITSMESAFRECHALASIGAPLGAHDLPNCINYSRAFYLCDVFNGNLPTNFMRYVPASETGVVDYTECFRSCSSFNKAFPVGMLSEFEDNGVRLDLNGMFRDMSAFDQALDSAWMVEACERSIDCVGMARGWGSFNRPIPTNVLQSFPYCTSLDYLCYGWAAFNQPLEIASNAPLVVSAAYCCQGMSSFNSAVGKGFFVNSLLLADVSYMCAGWALFNQPLTAPFFARGKETYTNVSGMCMDWRSFNQTPPVGFGNYPNATHWGVFAQAWYSMDSDLNSDFMEDCSAAVILTGALQMWDSMTKLMPPTMLTQFKQGSASQAASLSSIMDGWDAYNHDLHEGFLDGIGYYADKTAMLSGWGAMNSQMNSTLGTVASWGGGTTSLESCFRSWESMTQDVPAGFLEGFTACQTYVRVMQNWALWAHELPQIAVGATVNQPIMVSAFAGNALMTGAAGSVISQRTDWNPVPVTGSGEHVLDYAFSGCTALTDYLTIDTYWKDGYRP